MLLVGPLLILTFYALWTTFDSPPQILNDRMSKSAPVLETVLTVKLLKPLHRFHSDHWFHMAEYYLSNNNRTTCAAALINSGPSVVIIIAPKDPRFLEKLTKVAFFMLLLSFTDENMRTVLVVNHDFIPPDQVSRQGFQDFTPKRNLRLSVFSLAFDTMLQYDLTRPINDRFTPLYKHPSRPFSEHGKVSSIMDTITAGRTPMSSGRWFHSRDQVGRFRSKIARLCGCHNHSSLSPSWSSTTTTVTAAPRADCNSFSQSQSLRAAQPDILVSRKFNGSLLPFSLAIMRPLSDQLRLGGIRRYRMVIYERNSDRRFADLEGTLELLSEYTNGQKDTVSDDIIIWDIDIIYHSDEMNPCLLNAALRSADILITTHGFQSTGMFEEEFHAAFHSLSSIRCNSIFMRYPLLN